MKTKLFLALTLFSYSSIYAETNTHWEADIRVEDVKVTTSYPQGKEYNCIVDIANSNKDDARNSKAIILLAPQVHFENYTINNKSSQNDDYSSAECNVKEVTPAPTPSVLQQQTAVVECELGQLTTHAKLSISVTGNILPSKNFKKLCSAFVYSTTPDHTPINNFMKNNEDPVEPADKAMNSGPNLIVSSAQIDFSTRSVMVSVKNIGDQSAGNNLTYIEINKVGATDEKKPQSQHSVNIPSLDKGASWESEPISFSAFTERGLDLSTLSQGTLNLVVNVDAKDMVKESNEADNISDINY